MAEKRCRLGFSCASMMQQVEPRVEDCPNSSVCGVVQHLEPDAEFELVQRGTSGIEYISTTRRRAAAMLLMRRGCPQPVASFGLAEQIARLNEQLNSLTNEIAQYEEHYIAPDSVEAVAYAVKRPGPMVKTSEGIVHSPRVYWYNKLMSQSAIFAPAEKEKPVKVIHLSKSDDPRNVEGRRGVERRNELNQIATQLKIAERVIVKAQELASESSARDRIDQSSYPLG